MAVAPPISPGVVVAGRFLVERVVGSGGAGVVVAARHLALNKRVALKFLRSESVADGDAIRRFVCEARATAQLRSEHVIRVMDADTIDPSLAFIVMEFLEGRDLAQVVAQDGPLPIEDAVDFVLQACEAIAEAHARGIVHRDIKPSNLFLTRAPDGTPFVKVLDFGLSKLGWASGAITSENRVMGSPQFMSPEQMRSSHDADVRSDIWSMGVVLFTLLVGRCPFPGTYLMEICAAVLSGDVPRVRQARPEVPDELDHVVRRCLALEPEDRFQSVPQLAQALRPFLPARAADRAVRVVRIAETTEAAPFSAPASANAQQSHALPPPNPWPPSSPSGSVSVVAAAAAGWTGASQQVVHDKKGQRQRRVLVWGGVAVVLLAAGVAGLILGRWAHWRAPTDPLPASAEGEHSTRTLAPPPVLLQQPVAAPIPAGSAHVAGVASAVDSAVGAASAVGALAAQRSGAAGIASSSVQSRHGPTPSAKSPKLSHGARPSLAELFSDAK